MELNSYCVSHISAPEIRQKSKIFISFGLVGLSLLLILLTFSTLRNFYLLQDTYNGIHPVTILVITITTTFITLLVLLNRLQYGRIALLGVLIYGAIFCSFTWGPTLPFSMYLTILIPLAGIFLGDRGFVSLGVIGICLILISGYIEVNYPNLLSLAWKYEALLFSDVIERALGFSLIIGVIFIINKTLQKNLIREKELTKDLSDERDLLELRVTQRTQQLQESYTEQLSQANRIAEFGRMSQGALHDIGNISSQLSLMIDNEDVTRPLKKEDITLVSNQLRSIIRNVTQPSVHTWFDISESINNIISCISYESKLLGVTITTNLLPDDSSQLYGNKTYFIQCIHNILSNSLDALHNISNPRIEIAVNETDQSISLTIRDNGTGISEEVRNNIFDAGFTTKTGRHSGIGLSSTKFLLETQFNATISLTSDTSGTTCIVCFPKTYDTHSVYKPLPSSN